MCATKVPLISFVVPVHNAERTLHDCVCSITRQSFDDIEIILVNNCSTDGSFRKCNELAKEDGRIKVVDIAEKGVSAARNRGIELAIGEFVTFVDADDWIDSNGLSIAKFNKNNPLWQANYHDHIIRDDSEFQRIKNYIDYNPAKWEDDSLKQ